MCKKVSREIFDFLLDHVREVEKEKDLLRKEYYNQKAEESMEVEDFFREYTGTISRYLDTVKVGTGSGNSCPFAVINSIVEVQDMEDMEIYQYRIVLPYLKNTDMSVDCASCLSPLGKALLLQSINQQVNVRIPTGTLRYVIKKITVPEQGIFGHNKKQAANMNKPATGTGLTI